MRAHNVRYINSLINAAHPVARRRLGARSALQYTAAALLLLLLLLLQLGLINALFLLDRLHLIKDLVLQCDTAGLGWCKRSSRRVRRGVRATIRSGSADVKLVVKCGRRHTCESIFTIFLFSPSLELNLRTGMPPWGAPPGIARGGRWLVVVPYVKATSVATCVARRDAGVYLGRRESTRVSGGDERSKGLSGIVAQRRGCPPVRRSRNPRAAGGPGTRLLDATSAAERISSRAERGGHLYMSCERSDERRQRSLKPRSNHGANRGPNHRASLPDGWRPSTTQPLNLAT